jgi:DNA-binding transcriptional regulator YiaG
VSRLRFRNVNATPADPVESWPFEGVLSAVERGSLVDWRRLMAAVRRDPWGSVARDLEQALEVARPYGTAVLLERALQQARQAAASAECAEVARRVRKSFEASGLDRAAFAARIGTSTSRLSTYLTGRVAPSSTLLVRMERVAGAHEGNVSTRGATVQGVA